MIANSSLCSSKVSFGVFFSGHSFYLGNWNHPSSVSTRPAFYYVEQLYAASEILAFQCVQSIESAIILLRVSGKSDSGSLVLYNLTNVAIAEHTAVRNQYVDIKQNDTEFDVQYYEDYIYVKVGLRSYRYSLD